MLLLIIFSIFHYKYHGTVERLWVQNCLRIWSITAPWWRQDRNLPFGIATFLVWMYLWKIVHLFIGSFKYNFWIHCNFFAYFAYLHIFLHIYILHIFTYEYNKNSVQPMIKPRWQSLTAQDFDSSNLCNKFFCDKNYLQQNK